MSEYDFYPGFHFQVEFISADFGTNDSRFQTIGGLEVSMETETINEGGENRFEYILPTKTSYGTLSLKRGMMRNSDLIDWCNRTMQTLEIKPVDILITLLNEKHEAVMSWNIFHAWPKKWSVSDFNAMNNELTIETLDLQYLYFTRD